MTVLTDVCRILKRAAHFGAAGWMGLLPLARQFCDVAVKTRVISGRSSINGPPISELDITFVLMN